MSIEKNVETIKTLAPVVAQAAEESNAAHAEQQQAEIALLAQVVELVKPALRAISSRPLTCSDWTGLDGDEKPRTERATWAGVCLTGRPGPVQRGARSASGRDNTRGAWGGTDLFLRPDGTFVTLAYIGTWSNWQDARSPWHSKFAPKTVQTVITEDWAPSLAEIVNVLASKLTAEVNGKRSEATRAARERAAKLRALAALI